MTDETAPKLNLLVAYPYFKAVAPVFRDHSAKIRLLVDSGAFTAWRAGTTISVDDYCRFLESLPVTPWRYFTLDVVGDPQGTMRNYEVMLKRGLHPVPIFTRGEDPSVLEEYYRTSDVVGLGGLVGTAGNRGFVNGIMRHVGKRRCHWLGFTSMNFLKHYRPYMCDSSAWTSAGRYGSVHLYLGGGRSVRFHKAAFAQRPSSAILSAICSYGFAPGDLAKTAGWHGSWGVSRRLNGASAVRLSLDLQKALGVLYFCAISVEYEPRILLDAFYYDTEGRRPFDEDRSDSLRRGGQRDAGVSPGA